MRWPVFNGRGCGSIEAIRRNNAFRVLFSDMFGYTAWKRKRAHVLEDDVARHGRSKTDVVLYTLHGDGHVWPGGGALPGWLAGTDSRSMDATEVMWQFFRQR